MIIYYPPWERFWLLLNAGYCILSGNHEKWSEWASNWLDNNDIDQLKQRKSFSPDENSTKTIYLVCAGFLDAAKDTDKAESATLRKRFVFAALCLFEAQRKDPIASEAARIADRALEDLDSKIKSLFQKKSQQIWSHPSLSI